MVFNEIEGHDDYKAPGDGNDLGKAFKVMPEPAEEDGVDTIDADDDEAIIMAEGEALKEDFKATVRVRMCPEQAYVWVTTENVQEQNRSKSTATNALVAFKDYFTLVETVENAGDAEKHSTYFTWRIEDVPRKDFISNLFDDEEIVPLLLTDLGDIIPETIDDLATGEDVFAKEGFPKSLRQKLIEESKEELGFFQKAKGMPAVLYFPTLGAASVLAKDPAKVREYLKAVGAQNETCELKIKLVRLGEKSEFDDKKQYIHVNGEPYEVCVGMANGFNPDSITSFERITAFYAAQKKAGEESPLPPTMDDLLEGDEQGAAGKGTKESPTAYIKETLAAAENFKGFIQEGLSKKNLVEFYTKVMGRMTDANQESFPGEQLKPLEPEGSNKSG